MGRRWPQWLGILHASNVLEIRETGPGWIRVRMNMDGYEQIQAMDLPCLITMDMELACTTLTQIAVMFVIITAGILCSRFGVILGAASFAIFILVPTWIIQQRLPFLRKRLVSPCIIGVIVGLFLFIMRWKLPYVVLRPMEMLEDIRMADGTLLVKSMNIYLCFGLTSQIKFASIRY